MVATFFVPTAEDLRHLLTRLFGKDVTVEEVPSPSGEVPAKPAVAALYCMDDGTPAAVTLCDPTLAAFRAAALAMIPPTSAAEAVTNGVLDGSLLETLQEVCNVEARLFNMVGLPHVSLTRVFGRVSELPEEAAALLERPGGRIDFRVGIPSYGEGRMAVVTR